MTTFALIDGNSFYASCERVFRPDLIDRPIVVLSNSEAMTPRWQMRQDVRSPRYTTRIDELLIVR